MPFADLANSGKVAAGTIGAGAGTFVAHEFAAFLVWIPPDLPKLTGLVTLVFTLMMMYEKARLWWSRRWWSRYNRAYKALKEQRAEIRREKKELELLRAEVCAVCATTETPSNSEPE